MGETLSLSQPSFNRCVHIDSRESHLSSDCGAVLIREVVERTGLIEGLGRRLHDPRDPCRVTHPLPELLRDALTMTAQGWGDQGDATHLRSDPVFALSGSERRGQAAARRSLASQSSFSRLLGLLGTPDNQDALQAATIELVGRRLRAENGGRKRATLTIDIEVSRFALMATRAVRSSVATPGSASTTRCSPRALRPAITSGRCCAPGRPVPRIRPPSGSRSSSGSPAST